MKHIRMFNGVPVSLKSATAYKTWMVLQNGTWCAW